MCLNINKEKSKICMPQECVFLGYQISKKNENYSLDVSEKNKEKMRKKTQEIVKSAINNGDLWWNKLGEVHRGWINYFYLCEQHVLDNFLKDLQEKEMELINNEVNDSNHINVLFKSLIQSKEYVLPLEWLRCLKKRENENG